MLYNLLPKICISNYQNVFLFLNKNKSFIEEILIINLKQNLIERYNGLN